MKLLSIELRKSSKAFSLYLLLIVSSSLGFGQNLPAKATISKPWWGDENRPSSYYEKKVREGDFGQNDKTDIWWIVASDRAENTCFTSPGSGSRKGEMDLMETAAIIEIENGFAHLIQQNGSGRISVGWPMIPGNAVDKGWIPVGNILLFPKAITNENLIYEKAMVLTSIDDKTSRDNLEYNNSVNFKKGPDLKTPADKLSKTFEIYYVFKKTGNSVLLGRSDRLTLSDQDKENVLGWVSNSLVTFWNNRICLEPNWKTAAIQNFKKEGAEIVIFENSSINDAIEYTETGKLQKHHKVLKRIPFSNSRQDGYILRYPILEQLNEHTFRVSATIVASADLAKGAQISCKGIITTKVGVCDSSLFLPVVFLSRSELNRIVNTLEKIYIPYSSDAERRNNFREAIIGLIQGQLGAFSGDEILSKTMGEIYQILMGIPFKSSALKNLKDFIDPTVVSTGQFADYMDVIDDKLMELRKISSGSAFQYSYKANDQDFFWIPLEDIP